MPTTIPPDPGPPRTFPVPALHPSIQPVQPRRAEEPIPDIDPTLPGWARGMIAVTRAFTASFVSIVTALLAPSIVSQIVIIAGMFFGGREIVNNQIDTHKKIDEAKAELNNKVEDVKTHQAVSAVKLDSIKTDTKKLGTVKDTEK